MALQSIKGTERIGKLGFEAVDVWAHFEWAGPLCEHLEEGLEKLGPDKFSAFSIGAKAHHFCLVNFGKRINPVRADLLGHPDFIF